MDIFTCDACKYTFVCNVQPNFCPDCGKEKVRPASKKEIEEYKRIRLEIAAEDRLAANQ